MGDLQPLRAVFKIIRITPDKLSMYLDLRDLPLKSLNLNYGCQDVQWNPKEGNFIYYFCNVVAEILFC